LQGETTTRSATVQRSAEIKVLSAEKTNEMNAAIMKLHETSPNHRISGLTRELEQSRSPDQTVAVLQRAFADVDGFVASMMLSTRGLKPGQYRIVELRLGETTQVNLFSQSSQQSSSPVRFGGIIGDIIRRQQPQLVHDIDWGKDSFFADTLDGYDSLMAVPLSGDRLPGQFDGPASLLNFANRQLCDKSLGGFFTAFLGIFDPKSRQLTYANAGHPPPLVKRAGDGCIYPVDCFGGLPLGIDAGETFNEATVQLHCGDMLLLYTDGITEARGATSDLLEEHRLMRAAADCHDDQNSPTQLIQHLRETVRIHQDGEPPGDDQTLVATLVL
jgi:hypothetical protein